MNDDNDENRKMVESCYRTRKTMVNPIVDWSDEEVWEFLNDWAKVEHCSLYDEGFTRLGCIGCPLSGSKNMLRDFERWPKYKENYIKAFQRMIDNHPGQIKILRPEYQEHRKEMAEKIGKEFIDLSEDLSVLGRAGGYSDGGSQPTRSTPPEQKRYSSGGWKQERHDTPPPEKQQPGGLVQLVDNSRSCITGGYTTVTDDKLAEAIFDHWFVLLDGNTNNIHSLIFTLDIGETWEDKKDDIENTIRSIRTSF